LLRKAAGRSEIGARSRPQYRIVKGTRRRASRHPAPIRGQHIIGTAFFVMEFVDCSVLRSCLQAAIPSAARLRKRGAGRAAPGRPARCLADFGKAGSYFARQRDRWTKQYRASETEHLEDMVILIKWLVENEPPDDGRSSLVHGDYRLDNMIFKPDGSRLLAVIDWELSTIGHPFSDLAYQCMQWRFPNHETMRGLAGVDRAALGIPTEEEYVAKYCERVGISGIPTWKFCLAFSFFRLAAIVQGVKKRGLDGNASNPEKAIKSGERVPQMAKMGVEAIAS
jgi:aminoglycoside phosphotransferase (APT) family kinase protein